LTLAAKFRAIDPWRRCSSARSPSRSLKNIARCCFHPEITHRPNANVPACYVRWSGTPLVSGGARLRLHSFPLRGVHTDHHRPEAAQRPEGGSRIPALCFRPAGPSSASSSAFAVLVSGARRPAAPGVSMLARAAPPLVGLMPRLPPGRRRSLAGRFRSSPPTNSCGVRRWTGAGLLLGGAAPPRGVWIRRTRLVVGCPGCLVRRCFSAGSSKRSLVSAVNRKERPMRTAGRATTSHEGSGRAVS